MQIKDILSDTTDSALPIFKTDNYNNIYKKTEKIACAVFFITNEHSKGQPWSGVVSDIRGDAQQMLRAVIEYLSSGEQSIQSNGFREVARAASAVRSMLYVLVASQLLKTELADVLAREIDTVLYHCSFTADANRELHKISSLESAPEYVRDTRRHKPASLPRATPRSLPVTPGVETERTERNVSRKEAVLALIKDRGTVSIKDISDNVKDCSEKTLQRILIELIKDNKVVREGERRWSKYRLFSQS